MDSKWSYIFESKFIQIVNSILKLNEFSFLSRELITLKEILL